MNKTSVISLRRIGLLMLCLAIALGVYAEFQPDYIDANGFLVEPFAYRALGSILALVGAGATAAAWFFSGRDT